MKFISWNVNGIRAVMKKGFSDFTHKTNPDILCLQETKAHPDQVDKLLDDYEHHYWNSADKKGYSGTAVFSKIKPLKVVYGGGGIIPDVFIPKDTSIENETLNYVSRNGFMSYFIFEYLENNRSQFNKLSYEDFKKNYKVSDKLAEDFVVYSRLQEAQIDLSNYQEELKMALKANIAQQLYGPNAYEFILNADDAMLKKVLELEKKAAEK